ncbi:MAG TPA: winged helix-turn-helix domain-containing protein [Pyrinomonadaceae bacterium]|nr:winged helix-turn-helix domain-containing protein [Pyrinomonadaceae bacterium]
MSTELTPLMAARAAEFDAGASVYDDGRLRVEHDNYYVACDGSALQLPRKEFLILSRLALNAQRIVSSEDIWRHAWPPAAAFNAESLHVHIYRLRRRLAPFRVHIETMVNVGYRLVT